MAQNALYIPTNMVFTLNDTHKGNLQKQLSKKILVKKKMVLIILLFTQLWWLTAAVDENKGKTNK